MFLREVSRKNRDGSVVSYLQLVESVWNPETKTSRPQIIHSFGRVDGDERASLIALAENILRKLDPEKAARICDPVQPREDDAPSYPTRPFGAVHVLGELWHELGLDLLLRKKFTALGEKEPRTLERAVFAMVAHMAVATGSKRSCWRAWLAEQVDIPGATDLKLGRLYAAMDRLEDVEADVQRATFERVAGVTNADVELVFFYDTTSVYWEVEEDDEERVWKRPPRDAAPFRLRGHSKDHRPDAPQVVIAMAVTRDGFPVRSWVFPGNTVDVTTIERVKLDLNSWGLHRCVLVGDRGMTSQKNMRVLTGGGGGYILGVPMRRGEAEVREVLARQGRYMKVGENIEVKEIWYPSREHVKAQRYVMCRNPFEAVRDRQQREELLARLQAELEALDELRIEDRQQRVHELMANTAYRRYLIERGPARLKINRRKVHEEANLDGKYLITTSDPTLTATDLALGYKHLQQVERSWRTLKTNFEIGPVRHYAPRRIRAHVRLAQLALALTRLAEVRAEMTWPEAQMILDRVHSARIDHTLLGTTPTPPSTQKLMSKLRVASIPRLMPISGLRKVEREVKS